MAALGMSAFEFAIIMVAVVLVVARLAYRLWRTKEFCNRRGDDGPWWNY